jgi:hypothetical protein
LPGLFSVSLDKEAVMRGWVWAGLLGLAVFVIGVVRLADAQGPRTNAPERSGHDRAVGSADLLALSHDGPDGRQQITIVDPRQRVMAVYHVDRTSGALALKSVRNLQWDLMIEDYNSGTPAPRDIRALKEQQR